MKKILLWLLNLLWRIQFKKELFAGLFGYHCKECKGGDDPTWCGKFYCPVEKKPFGKLVLRFESVRYRMFLCKLRSFIN